MANQSAFTSQDIDRMKNDAIRRARQMQSRATIQGPSVESKSFNTQPSKAKENACDNTANSYTKLPFLNGFNDIISQLGLTNEQLIIFAIILMLCESRDNRLLIMALLYIAL